MDNRGLQNGIENVDTVRESNDFAKTVQENECLDQQPQSLERDCLPSMVATPFSFLPNNADSSVSVASIVQSKSSSDSVAVSTGSHTSDEEWELQSIQSDSHTTYATGDSSVSVGNHSSDEAWVSDVDEDGDTPLHTAILFDCTFERGDVPVQYLNLQNDQRQTPLHLAAHNENAQNVDVFVTCGADPIIQDSKLRTPLHIACGKGNSGCVNALLGLQHNKIDQLGIYDNHGQNCLHIVVCSGNVALAKVLLENGADINAPDRKSGRTALHFAVDAGNVDMIKFLLQYLNNDGGLSLDSSTFAGETPLQLAYGRRNTDVVAILEPFYPASERRNPYDVYDGEEIDYDTD